MDLVVVGLNHKTTPIEIRERMAFAGDEIGKALAQVQSIPWLKENMILSTCNRVELYAVAREATQAIIHLKEFLSEYHHLSLQEFEKNLYFFAGEDAVKHIFRVASSLDSMVVGEPQILGQIKEAYEMATEAKTSGLVLHRLLHQAFHVAKKVRTETKIGNSAVSVSSIAVELARKIFETLEEKTVLLIGAGEMCALAAQHLVAGGVEKVLVTNRTYARAVLLAQDFKGEPVPFEEMDKGLKRADIVISATDSRTYILLHDQVARMMKERKQRPIFFIDIADPRDIEPRVNDLENVYLYNIDHLQKVAEENMKDRELEAQKAEAFIQQEVARFVQWYRSLDVTPTIVALREKFEGIRKKELEKIFSRLQDLTEKEKQSLETLTLAIINKILHDPLSCLKRMDERAMADLYIDALQNLFQLSVKGTESAEEYLTGAPSNTPSPANVKTQKS